MLSFNKPCSNLYVIIYACISLLGGVSTGIGLAFTGPTIDTMRDTVIDKSGEYIHIHPSSNLYVLKSPIQSSLFSSSLLIGGAIGTIFGGPLADSIGRRAPLFMASLISVLSFLILGLISNIYGLIIIRFINGIAVGIYSFVVSVYIGEIAPTNLRGVLGGCMSLAIAIGIALTYSFGVAALTKDNNTPADVTGSHIFCNWRLVSFLSIIPSGIQLFTPFVLPESPRWLAMKGRTAEASRILARLRNCDINDTQIEVELSISSCRYERNNNITRVIHSWILCWREVIISIMIHVLVQLSGVSTVTLFQTTIFLRARLGRPDIMAITVQLVTILANACACCIIDKIGRRPLLLMSCFGMMISQVIMGTYFYIDRLGTATSLAWLSVLSAYLYQIAYAFGYGPVRFMISSEIFPDQIRSFAASMSVFGNWVSAFLCILVLEYAISGTSLEAVYWFYAVSAALSFLFVYFRVPETKGKSLDEVRSLFSH